MFPSVAERAARIDTRFSAPFTTEAAFLAREVEEAEYEGRCASERHAIEAAAEERAHAAAHANEAARRADPNVPVSAYFPIW